MNLANHSFTTHDFKDLPSIVIAMLVALGAQEWLQIILESKLAATIGAAVITILFNVWRYLVDRRDPYKDKYIASLEAQLRGQAQVDKPKTEQVK